MSESRIVNEAWEALVLTALAEAGADGLSTYKLREACGISATGRTNGNRRHFDSAVARLVRAGKAVRRDVPTGVRFVAAGPASPAKRRTCLRCGKRFRSSWAGERVCGPCKKSADWRAGQDLTAGDTGGRVEAR